MRARITFVRFYSHVISACLEICVEQPFKVATYNVARLIVVRNISGLQKIHAYGQYFSVNDHRSTDHSALIAFQPRPSLCGADHVWSNLRWPFLREYIDCNESKGEREGKDRRSHCSIDHGIHSFISSICSSVNSSEKEIFHWQMIQMNLTWFLNKTKN